MCNVHGWQVQQTLHLKATAKGVMHRFFFTITKVHDRQICLQLYTYKFKIYNRTNYGSTANLVVRLIGLLLASLAKNNSLCQMNRLTRPS